MKAGQFIGWTTKGSWHVHLTEFFFPGDGRRLLLNPLRPGGKAQALRRHRGAGHPRRPLLHAGDTDLGPARHRRRAAAAGRATARQVAPDRNRGYPCARERSAVVPRLVPRCPAARRAAPPVPDRAPARPASQRARRAAAHGLHRRSRSHADRDRSALRARDEAEPPRRARDQAEDPGRRRILVPAVPEALLEHDAPAERPLPPRRQSVGRGRQPARSDIEIAIRNPPV